MAEEIHTPTTEEIDNLKYADKYIGLESYLQVKFQSVEITAFRMVHNPIDSTDSMPYAEKHPERVRSELTQEELKEMHESMSNPEKKSEVGLYGMSHFTNPLQCALALQSRYEKLKDINPEEAEEYKNQFGTFVVKVNYTRVDGLSEREPNSKGHFEFLPKNGFELSEHIDPKFGKQYYETIIENENL